MDAGPTLTRYDRKREEIISAASALINQRGASAVTLRDVAEAVQLQTSALIYYFKNKTQLAAAVFETRLGALEDMIRQAEQGATPIDRVRELLKLELAQLSGVLQGTVAPLASLVSSNEGPEFEHVRTRVLGLFKRISRLLDSPAGEAAEARSYLLIGLLFFLPSWAPQYPTSEFPRMEAQLINLLERGIAAQETTQAARIFDIDGELRTGGGKTKAEFLRAASRLMNVSGYNAASVDRIAEELSVTKGSLYHHFESKDALVYECVSSNFRRMSHAISQANAAGGTCLERIRAAMASLLNVQFENDWPLLRSTALASLPPPLREEVRIRSNRVALRFAGLIMDGTVEGTIRPVDPLITGHAINSALYAAFGLQDWAAQLGRSRAIEVYTSTILDGIFDLAV